MRRHEPDITSLVAGLVFVAIAAAYLVSSFTSVHVDAGWVLPFGLVGLGLAGVVGSLARARRADQTPAERTVAEAAAQPWRDPDARGDGPADAGTTGAGSFGAGSFGAGSVDTGSVDTGSVDTGQAG